MAQDRLSIPFSLRGKSIWVAGHAGMVGGALMRRLSREDGVRIITAARGELDLRDQAAVRAWLAAHKPDIVIMSAAKVSGIYANDTYRAEFFYDNISMNTNVIHESYAANVQRLLVLGSSCIYPRAAVQPITEDSLLSGALEQTNEAYALAKIAALKMVEYYRMQYGCDFIAAMPCNLYGVGDRYDTQNSHVIPALIMRAHQAKVTGAPVLKVWGSGRALREFMDVDDLADGLVYILQHYCGNTHINIGSGNEIAIKNLIQIICEVVGFEGKIEFDSTMPDGTPRKVMDTRRLSALGWHSEMCRNSDANMSEIMKNGIRKCYADYLHRVIGDDYTT